MKMSEKCRNSSDNPLTSRRTDGGKHRHEMHELSFQHNTSRSGCTSILTKTRLSSP